MRYQRDRLGDPAPDEVAGRGMAHAAALASRRGALGRQGVECGPTARSMTLAERLWAK